MRNTQDADDAEQIKNSFAIIHKLIETYIIVPPKKQTKNEQTK